MAIDPTSFEWPAFPAWWPNLEIGILFALFGLAGAAITVFLALANWESIIGRTETLSLLEGDIKEKREKAKTAQQVDERAKWEAMIDSDENQLVEERKMMRNYGIGLYIIAGSLIAAALARNVLEAVWIGASWTAVVGIIGIKVDTKSKQGLRAIEEQEQVQTFLKTLELAVQKTKQKGDENAKTSFNLGFLDAIDRLAKAQGKERSEVMKVL